MTPGWIIFAVVIVAGILIAFVKPAIDRKRQQEIFGAELDDPYDAEVLYDGVAVADLSDREFTEMFWRDYRIEPRTSEAKAIIENDDLWDECVFDFRDPITGNVCASGFVGGSRPFIRDGKITLRALYFGGAPNKTEPEQVGGGQVATRSEST